MAEYLEFVFHQNHFLHVIKGDITHERVDAIVNAANQFLQHGGGVAGAISLAGGSIVQTESDDWIDRNGPISHAHPAFTSAGRLPCRYIIHAAGPVWGEGDEEFKLRTTIRGCFLLAEELKITSIAFPAISTGIFGFPCQKAAQIFHEEIFRYFEKNPRTRITLVRMVLFDPDSCKSFFAEFSGKD